jgi:hypothetical protein
MHTVTKKEVVGYAVRFRAATDWPFDFTLMLHQFKLEKIFVTQLRQIHQ